MFVAVALPTLVWGVFALVRDSVSDEQLVDAAFGAFVGLLCVAILLRRSAASRATSEPRPESPPPNWWARGESPAAPCGWIVWARSVRGKG